MKKYATPQKLHLVGKAWEIRHALRQEKKLRGGNTPLIELLSTVSRKSGT
ncbi:Z-ring formation inhibitor MciZ [Cohnella silvisoli]|nr:Z-ring formation inhibitor MciZ [Cohnella silvisoli]MCD9021286.1 Z-ring formation inhibitor MciZ [Cohnella silvisoli]